MQNKYIKYIANHENQDLELHNVAVGEIAKGLAELITYKMQDKKMRQTIVEQSCLAGYLHDVGKADPNFQKFIKKKIKTSSKNLENKQSIDDIEEEEIDNTSKKSRLYHNQISYLSLDINFRNNNAPASYAIYHHHSHHRNKPDFDPGDPVDKDVSDFSKHMLSIYKNKYGEPLPKGSFEAGHVFTTNSAEKTIVAMCVIQADRWVSEMGAKLSSADLSNTDFCDKFVEFKNSLALQKSVNISGLYSYQQDTLDEIKNSKKSTFIISGPAGCGKTAISIAFCNSFDRKLDLFVAPRNTICHSLYDTIDSDLSCFGITKTRQLITASEVQKYSDESKKDIMSSDIVIINIDSVLGSYFNHYKFGNLINYLTQPMVIDEYHELNTKAAILSVARNLIAARDLLQSKTLLISATPVNILLNLEISSSPAQPIDFEEIHVPFPSDIDTNHHFTIHTATPVEKIKQPHTWVKCNTIGEVQSLFQSFDKNGLIVHSKYDKFDREAKMSICNSMYGKSSTREKINVFSSPINECSLNNSYDHAALELSTPYSLVQSLGRVRRFKEDNISGVESNISLFFEEKDSPSTKAYINIVYDYELFEKWKEFVRSNFDNVTLKKSQVLDLFNTFNQQNKSLIEDWTNRNIKESRKAALSVKAKVNSSKKIKNGEPVLADKSLRGAAGTYCAWHIQNGFYKIYALSPLDKKYLAKEMGVYGGANGFCEIITKTKAFTIDRKDDLGIVHKQQINLNYPKKPDEDAVFKKARKISCPIFLDIEKSKTSNEFKPWAFGYDKEDNIEKNIGIFKISNDNEFLDEDI